MNRRHDCLEFSFATAGIVLFIGFCICIIVVIASDRTIVNVYSSRTDLECSVYKSDTCLKQCGCGFCGNDNTCYGRDFADCPANWKRGNTPACQDTYDTFTRNYQNAGYASIGLGIISIFFCVLSCIVHEYDKAKEQTRRIEMQQV